MNRRKIAHTALWRSVGECSRVLPMLFRTVMLLATMTTATDSMAAGSADIGVSPKSDLEEIVVNGSILKMNIPIQESPQSVSIVSRQQLDEQSVQTVEEALRYIPSIQAEITGRQGYEEFQIRGFDQSQYQFRDGLRLDPGYLQTQEPYGLERIEVLKGPSSVLYGQIAPGGLVNLVSKLPQAVPVGEFGVTAGSYGLVNVHADVGDTLDSAHGIRYRLPVLYSNHGDPVDIVHARRVFASPSIEWQPSADTDCTSTVFTRQSRICGTWLGSRCERLCDLL